MKKLAAVVVLASFAIPFLYFSVTGIVKIFNNIKLNVLEQICTGTSLVTLSILMFGVVIYILDKCIEILNE